ncbi:MAG: hypothetical protein II794_02165 [Oscillospiraceae bacterium]|nr:hypothetical protein [Oscillospiraceae bacterium]
MAKKRPGYGVPAAALAVLAAFLCRRGVLHTENEFLEQLFNFLRIFIYLGLFTLWGELVRRRVVQVQARRYLMWAAAIIVVWLALRELRWHFILDENLRRYLWYSYYIPLVTVPLLALFVSLSLGRPGDYRLPGAAALLYIPTAAIILAILTNDLHGLVFRFPAGAFSEAGYVYGPLFYVSAAWAALCALGAFAVMAVKARGVWSLWLPAAPYGLAILYTAAYAMRLEIVRSVFDDLAVTEALLYTAFFECCIQCGLIQSNTRYRDLFRHSLGISAQITDGEYNVAYASGDAAPVSREDMQRAQAGPVLLEGGKMLHNMSIRGGHALWTEDVSELMAVQERLAAVQEELEDRNEIVRAEYAQERQRLQVEEQNRLYDLLQQETQSRLDLAWDLAARYEAARGPERERLLGKIVVIGSYIKRKKDLTLSREASPLMDRSRLARALEESLRSAGLLGIRGGAYVEEGEPVPAAVLIRAYDFFEAVLEALMDGAHYINTAAAAWDGPWRCVITADALAPVPLGRTVPDGDGGAVYSLELEGGGEE